MMSHEKGGKGSYDSCQFLVNFIVIRMSSMIYLFMDFRFFTNLRDICEQNRSATGKKSEKGNPTPLLRMVRSSRKLWFIFFFPLGGRQKCKDARKNESPDYIVNEGPSHLHLNANEQCSDEDVMDCLVSFYGDVS